MDSENSSAYIINRRGKSVRERRGGGKKAGALIAALIILSAVICLLVVFIPRAHAVSKSSEKSGGTKIFALCMGEFDGRPEAELCAKDTGERGGAGYVYNDGKYRVIAALYLSEQDAAAVAKVNEGASYFAIEFPLIDCDGEQSKALDYFFGEWFSALSNSAAQLEKGEITQANAEFAARSACKKLRNLCVGALDGVCEMGEAGEKSVLSFIRYTQAKTACELYSRFT